VLKNCTWSGVEMKVHKFLMMAVPPAALLERTSQFWPRSVSAIVNQSIIRHGLGGCSKLLDGRKHAKLQWLQDPGEVNEDNLSNVRQEASKNFRNNKSEYKKGKINEVESNSKNNIRDLFRGITEFWKGYQPRTIW
jgi:hypothetical protein